MADAINYCECSATGAAQCENGGTRREDSGGKTKGICTSLGR